MESLNFLDSDHMIELIDMANGFGGAQEAREGDRRKGRPADHAHGEGLAGGAGLRSLREARPQQGPIKKPSRFSLQGFFTGKGIVNSPRSGKNYHPR